MDINLLRNVITVSAFLSFLAIVWWAYAPSRKAAFEEIGRAVVEDRE
ncbi:MAG: cbb3-type cytochrome oxidase subunit 3 [Clostridia bacterium]